MATITLADLLAQPTEDGLLQAQLDVLALAGFPVTTWTATSVPRVLLKADARALVDSAALIPKIAAGGLNSLSTADWLTLLASSNYLNDRKPGVFTERKLRLTDAGGAPVTISVGASIVSTAAGLRFRNTTGGTLGVGGTLDLAYKAESPGAAYNGATTAWSFVTATPGVDLTDAPAGILVQGADEETDIALRQRNVDRWSSLGAGANDGAYRYWATTTPGVFEVTRVKVRETFPLPGQVTVYLAGSSGPVSGGAVAAVQAYIDPPSHKGKAPNAIDVFVLAATSRVVPVTATVKVKAGGIAAARSGIETALADLASTSAIGDTIYLAEFVQRVMDQVGVIDVVFTAPAANVVLLANEVLVIPSPLGLTFVEV